jgi:alkylation response protein AidB-like acyl-CoA dehydrogenase
MTVCLRYLIQQRPLPFTTWIAWWRELSTILAPVSAATPASIAAQQALLAGTLSEGAEQAFMAGYQLALALLVNGKADRLRAFAVTEGAGKSLRAMETRVVADGAAGQWKLSGHKAFVTLPEVIDECFVLAASAPEETGRATVVVRLERAQLAQSLVAKGLVPPGLAAVNFGKLAFSDLVLPHAAMLAGNGHEDYSKRFRWLEDHLVLIALQGWMLRSLLAYQKAAAADPDLLQDAEMLLLLCTSLQNQLSAPADDVLSALVFAGVRRQMGELMKKWQYAPPGNPVDGNALSTGLKVMHGLVGVAASAQGRRREKAWLQTLGA